jgi:glycosyltransferase involved in cell wall biosynthesis
MNDIICLNIEYSTTQRLINNVPEIEQTFQEKYTTHLFLPKSNIRIEEGGLRKKGYYKKSFTDKPLISIVTVVLNDKEHIEETILSVLTQKYDNIEYIIIDGGSSDGTLEIIKKYNESIDYWISEKDQGISDAFNKGIICTLGELVGIINSGDYYESEVFNYVVYYYIQNYSLKEFVLYGKTFKINLSMQKLEKKDNSSGWAIRVPFSHCSSFTTRAFYKKYGLFDLSYKIAMDVDLLMRGLKEAHYIQMPYFIATQRDGGLSDKNRIEGYREYRNVSKKYFGLFKSYFFYYLRILIIYKSKIIRW